MGWRDAAVSVSPAEAKRADRLRKSIHAQDVARTSARADELRGDNPEDFIRTLKNETPPELWGDSEKALDQPSSIPDVEIPFLGNLRRLAPGEDSGATAKEAAGAFGLSLANKLSADIVPTLREASSSPIRLAKALVTTNPAVIAAQPGIAAAQRGLGFLAEHGAPVPDFLLPDKAVDPESLVGREQAAETPESAAADIAPAATGQGGAVGDAINLAMSVPGLVEAAPTIAKGLGNAARSAADAIRLAPTTAADVAGAARDAAVAGAAKAKPAAWRAAAQAVEHAPYAIGGAAGGLVGHPAAGALIGKAALGEPFANAAEAMRLRAVGPSGPAVPGVGALAEDIGTQSLAPSGLELDEINGGRIARQLAELKQRMGMGVEPGGNFADAGADVMTGGPSMPPPPPAPPIETPEPQGRPVGGSQASHGPVPDITGLVDQPQPAPNRGLRPQVDWDVSGHPEGQGPEAFPLQPHASGQGWSMSADMLRGGLRPPGVEDVTQRISNPTGFTPEWAAGPDVEDAAARIAAREAQSVNMRGPKSDPSKVPLRLVASDETAAGMPLPTLLREANPQAADTEALSPMRLRALLENPEAHPPLNPADFPGQGIRLFPQAEPGSWAAQQTFIDRAPTGPATEMAPGVKMPARFPAMPSGPPSTWTPAQQAQAARVDALNAQLDALSPAQRARAVQALAQAHGSAPWQAGRVGAQEGAGIPFRSEAAPPRPASEFGAHTPKQELAGVTGFDPMPPRSPVVPPSPVEDAMAPMVKAAAEAQMRADLARAGAPVEEDLPSFVRKVTPGSGGDLKSRTWKAREEGEAIEPGYVRKATAEEAKADALPKDRDALLQQILDANGIGDHDSAAADSAYRSWKAESAKARQARKDWIAGGRQGAAPPPPPPKPTHNLGGLLDSFDAVKDNPGKVSSLLEAWEKQTKGMKTYRDLKPALSALADALGVDDLRLPDEVLQRHVAADAARSER